MTVKDVISKLNAKVINLADPDKEVSRGYCGDLLSHVMGKAPSGCCWFTVMANVNVAAVALLSEAAMVVVCEGTKCDPLLVEKAKLQEITLLETDDDIFESVKAAFL